MSFKFIKITLAVLVVAGGIWFFTGQKNTDGEIDYTTSKVERGDISNIVATSGTLKAVGTVDVGSQISGQISQLFVDFNSEVKTGDLLAQLDARTYEGRVKQSEASLEISKANVVQQQANLQRAEADLAEAKRLLERQKQLSKAGHISESELDRLVTQQKSYESQVTIAKAQLGNALASVTQADASLFQARIDLERCTIVSPVDGVVINRQIELGQTVAASMNAPVLFTIAQDLREMQVEASIDEADIGKIQEGQATTFTVEAFANKNFNGEIKQVRKAATEVQNVVTYTVVISAKNQDLSLLPGMTTNIEVITGKKENVIRVPNTALRFKPAGANVEEQDPRAAFVETRLQSMTQELQLTKEQEKSIRKIFEEQLANLPSPSQRNGPPGGFGGFGGPPPGGFSREGGGNRPSLFNMDAIREILSEEQYQNFRQMNRENGMRRRTGGERTTAGQVWVLGANDALEMRQIRVGLVGDEFSEVVAGNLKEGDLVVTRARRNQP